MARNLTWGNKILFLLNKLEQMIIINVKQEKIKSRYHKNNQVYLDTKNGETQQCNFKRSSSNLYYLRRFHAIHNFTINIVQDLGIPILMFFTISACSLMGYV
ncbi:hypothetical protein CFP56_037044 [Quercus suber]|uniref:Uncharacterized protein n=1 Tax=Quercus suber TaxID=58331 RepID=A0AAW0J5Z0_QUESU